MGRSAKTASADGQFVNAKLKVVTSLPRDDPHWIVGVHLISVSNFGIQGGVFFDSGVMPEGPELQRFAAGLPLLDQEEANLSDGMKALGLAAC